MTPLDDYLFTYFASGANSPGDMLGLIDCSMDWGCSVSELTPRWELGVQYTQDTDVLTFWDSGAFSEMSFSSGRPKVKYPINHEDWLARLDIYLWVAHRLGPSAYLVAPDQIGVQSVTLKRLKRYADYMQRCRDFGAEVIVPHQSGELGLEDFTHEAELLLGFDDFVVGFPMKRGVTSLVTVRAYCEEMQPSRVHLLGMGPRRRERPQLLDCLAAIEEVSPETEVFCDSVLLRGMRERTQKLRPLTRAEDEAVALLQDRLNGAPPSSIPLARVLADPRAFLGHVRWRLLLESWEERGRLSKDALELGLLYPEEMSKRIQQDPKMSQEVKAEWSLVTKTSAAVIWRRRESIRRVLCPGSYDPGVTEAEAQGVLEGPPRPKRRRR